MVNAAANAIGAKIIGIMGAPSNPADTRADLGALAIGTGAIDSLDDDAPLVMNGAGASAPGAIGDAIRLLSNGIPLDIAANPVDDPADAVDAVVQFIDTLEPALLGTPECAAWNDIADTNADGYQDFRDVTPGTPVCWTLIPKMNTTVQPTEDPQLFTATIEVYGDGVTLLDTRDVYFLVPPVIVNPPTE